MALHRQPSRLEAPHGPSRRLGHSWAAELGRHHGWAAGLGRHQEATLSLNTRAGLTMPSGGAALRRLASLVPRPADRSLTSTWLR